MDNIISEKLGISLYDKENMIDDIYDYIIHNMKDIIIGKIKSLDITKFINFASNVKVYINFIKGEYEDSKGGGAIYIKTNKDDNLPTLQDDKIYNPKICINVSICNNMISKRGIYHVLYHEINHLYQAYLSRKSDWYRFTALNGKIGLATDDDKYKSLNEDLINMIYRLLSETEYSSMISGSWSDMIYYDGKVIYTYGYLFYEHYTKLLSKSIESINETNFELYKELLKEYNLQKYIKQDLNNFKSNLKKSLIKKFNKLWKDLSRLDKLSNYRNIQKKNNESHHLKSFDEFISE